MSGRHGYSLENRGKFQNLKAEALAEFCGVLSQREPIRKNPWILKPNGQPLADFGGEFAIVFGCSFAGEDYFEFVLKTQHGLTQIVATGKFLHPRDGGGDIVELQFFGSE